MEQPNIQGKVIEARLQERTIKIKSFIALVIIVFIPFGIMIWFRHHQSTGFASTELILYPLIFGGISILIIYLIKKYFLKESLNDFNSEKGNFVKDIVWGFVLTVIYFILFYVARFTLTGWLTFIPNKELITLMLEMRSKPLYLALWFGPVLWIGVALYEELIRVYVLSSLWKLFKSKTWTYTVIVLTSLLMGLAHMSQGSYGIVTITLKSLIAYYFFYKFRRLLPLIIAHALYDGIQVAAFIIIYP
jgi:membrane protease YdiL (CAAX protease family)